jgi:peroxiredoxin
MHGLGLALLLSGFAAGCGGGTETAPTAKSATSGPAVQLEAPAKAQNAPTEVTATLETSESSKTPVVAVSAEKTSKLTTDSSAPSGTGEAPKAAAQFPDDEATKILQEIQQLRIAPVAGGDIEKAKVARRERNEQIVDKATQVLRLLKDDEKRAPQFHLAIGQLLEARFQMALAGTQEDVEVLYSDVQALNDRDPKSIAAAEGVYYIAKFAHTQAGMHGRTNPEWFSTLSRWAREFADRFPTQQKRAVSLLFGAARSCELQAQATKDADLSKRLMTESTLCYTALAEKFPSTEQGQEAVASLRRNALVGQVLTQFSGPTADGGMISADDFPGKPTLIYFWDSESDDFTKDVLPLLEKLRKQLSSERLRMVGVALDEDESLMNTFMETHNVPGQQIFFTNPEQRSWNSPLIRFWGIAKTPSIWLVDAEGKVTTTTVEAENLVNELKKIVK